MSTPQKPKFIWSGNDHYQRCIIEDMCIMLTIHKENFGFYQGKLWVNNELYLIERAHPYQRVQAVLEHAALGIYLETTK